jgi:hypothetical protein
VVFKKLKFPKEIWFQKLIPVASTWNKSNQKLDPETTEMISQSITSGNQGIRELLGCGDKQVAFSGHSKVQSTWKKRNQ